MSYIPLERVIDITEGSIYKLVILASTRALEIAEGLPPLVEKVNDYSKCTTVALRELAEGKVGYKKT